MITPTPHPDYHPLGYVNINGRWMQPAPSYTPPKTPDEQTQNQIKPKSREIKKANCWKRATYRTLSSPSIVPPHNTLKMEYSTLSTKEEPKSPPPPPPPPSPPTHISKVPIPDENIDDFQIEELCHTFSSNPLDGCEVISLLPFQGKLKNYSHVSNNMTFKFDDFICNCVIKVEKGSVDYIIIVHINPERPEDPDHHHLKITFHGEYKCYHIQFTTKENSRLYIGTIINSEVSKWLCRVPKEFQSQKYKKLLTILINTYRPAYPIVWGPFMINYDVNEYLTI